LLIFSSFSPPKDITTKANQPTEQSSSKIVFLFFNAQKSATGETVISLESQKTVDGTLNTLFDDHENALKEGDLIIQLTDHAGKIIHKQIVEDPLHPVLESYDGDIKRHQLTLDKGEFSIRFPYAKEIQTVQIDRVSPMGKKRIFTKKLQS